ncbi:MAG: class II fumarate hydratase [Opitutaceae bacterium]|jgi:fumarate hydratase class II
MATRIERDSLGTLELPCEAYYGVQTQRAISNFPISGRPMPPRFIHAMGRIKRAAAGSNAALGLIDGRLADAIIAAATEVIQGKLDSQFPVDVFQTGSGTSTNMNANEVIASRANEILGGNRGDKAPVHPNDHVNLCQSSNDVIPTALHISVIGTLCEELIPALAHLKLELTAKAQEFDSVLKIGRTHLQDATPVRLGQVFSGYAAQVEGAVSRARHAVETLGELPLGGTAVGTGLNAHPDFARRTIAALSAELGVPLSEARNHFEASAARDAVVSASGDLRTIAVSLAKIANDIRLLGSGPRCGFGELRLPAVQPGSSIMPGKVNPVIAESMIQVSMWVIGADLTITLGGLQSFLELSVGMPLMAYQLLESSHLLASGARNFSDACVKGLEADRERCASLVEMSLAMCTPLAPRIGYDKAAAIAKKAFETGKTVREVAREMSGLSEKELDELLDLKAMTEPGIRGRGGE